MSYPVLIMRIMVSPRKYTADELIRAVPKARSVAQVLRQIGLRPAGGNYKTLQRHIEELGLDTSHFKGQGWARGLTIRVGPKILLEAVLVDGSSYNTYDLKRRLIAQDMKQNKCEACPSRSNLTISTERTTTIDSAI